MKTYFEKRPWGNFEQFVKNKLCTVKIITILPRQETSLQFHRNRSEFWKILKGSSLITIGEKIVKDKKRGVNFFIPKKKPHRITAQRNTVEVLEISFGEFKEKDIVRIKDKYGRI